MLAVHCQAVEHFPYRQRLYNAHQYSIAVHFSTEICLTLVVIDHKSGSRLGVFPMDGIQRDRSVSLQSVSLSTRNIGLHIWRCQRLSCSMNVINEAYCGSQPWGRNFWVSQSFEGQSTLTQCNAQDIRGVTQIVSEDEIVVSQKVAYVRFIQRQA